MNTRKKIIDQTGISTVGKQWIKPKVKTKEYKSLL